MSAWHRPDVETAALDYLTLQVGRVSARQIVDGLLAKGRAMACGTCCGPVEWIDCPTGGWWRHAVHPADGHDAQTIPAAALAEDGGR